MSLHIPENYFQVSFGYAVEDDPELAYTSLGFGHSGGYTEQELFQAASWINESWQTAFKSVTATQWAMTGSYMLFGNTSPPYVRVDLPGTQVGTGATQSLPNNCSALVKKSTATPGRQGRGRMYVPGLVNNAAAANGVINSQERALWQDAVETFLSELSLSPDPIPTVTVVLFHDESSPIQTPSTVIGMSVDRKIATQRRRMR